MTVRAGMMSLQSTSSLTKHQWSRAEENPTRLISRVEYDSTTDFIDVFVLTFGMPQCDNFVELSLRRSRRHLRQEQRLRKRLCIWHNQSGEVFQLFVEVAKEQTINLQQRCVSFKILGSCHLEQMETHGNL